MSKKAIGMLVMCAAVSAFSGCGGKEDEVDSTEAVLDASEKEPSADAAFSYNVEDYVTLGDYMGVEITLNEADYQVTDEIVNTYADQMVAQYQSYTPDESKTVVEAGDVVNVDYVGKKDGVPFDGGSAEDQLIDTSNNTNAQTGGGYIDGFSDGLVGASVGETVDCEVTFPDNYQAEELKGQKVIFTFTVNSIQVKDPDAKLDDAFVQENFQAESVDDFYADVRSHLEQEAESSREADIRAAVIEAVVANCTVSSLPEGLLEKRVDEYIEGFRKQYCPDGDLDEFLQSNYNVTQEEFRNQGLEYMETNLSQELVFEAIAKKEGIAFDQEGFDTYLEGILSTGQFASKEELFASYGGDAASGEAYMKNMYLENKACTLVAEQAKINYTEADANDNSVQNTEQ